MWLRLRQIALVAGQLSPAVDALTLGPRHRGLLQRSRRQDLWPRERADAGGQPVHRGRRADREGTAAGRYLERRGGDGGYMVITQCDDHDPRRARVEALGVRQVFSFETPGEFRNMQLHPKDTGWLVLRDRRTAGHRCHHADGPWEPAGRLLEERAAPRHGGRDRRSRASSRQIRTRARCAFGGDRSRSRSPAIRTVVRPCGCRTPSSASYPAPTAGPRASVVSASTPSTRRELSLRPMRRGVPRTGDTVELVGHADPHSCEQRRASDLGALRAGSGTWGGPSWVASTRWASSTNSASSGRVSRGSMTSWPVASAVRNGEARVSRRRSISARRCCGSGDDSISRR